VKLSTKALRFMIDAVQFHAAHFEALRDDVTVDEDDQADAANDARFLRELESELKAEHERLVADPDAH